MSVVQASAIVVLATVAATSWVQWLSKRLSGSTRALSLLPVFWLLHWLPRLFNAESQPVGVCLVATMVWWWPSFKLLAFCLNRGSLIAAGSWLDMFARLFLPIVILSRERSASSKADSAGTMLLRCVAKLVIFAAVIAIATSNPHAIVRELCYLLCIYLFASLLMVSVVLSSLALSALADCVLAGRSWRLRFAVRRAAGSAF